MDFLVELSCVIRRLDEPTFTDYHDSIPLFVKDNPALGTKWYEFLEKIHVKPKNESKKWRQILREIRYWKDQELDHMYQRIMRVSRQVMGENSYFEAQTKSGKGTIPDRTTVLNRLIETSNELLSAIYPSVTRQINYRISDEEIFSSNIRGSVNWQKSIQHAIKNSGGIPTTFVCTIPVKSFATTENLLLYLAVSWLHKDSIKLLYHHKTEYVSSDEKKKIWKIINATQRVLDSPLLSEIKKETGLIHSFTYPTNRIKSVLDSVENQIKLYKSWQSDYLKLTKWIRKYLDFNVNRYQNLINFSFEQLEDFDKMFELWVLFEMTAYLKQNFNAKIKPIIKKKKLKGFRFEINSHIFTLYHEKYYKVPIGKSGLNLPGNQINPDYTIENNEKCCCGNTVKTSFDDEDPKCECGNFTPKVELVMDAKNWRNFNRMEAVQKMAWYMVQMNKYGPKTAILFFSNYEDYHKPSNPRTDYWSPVTVNQGEWEFISYVVKSSRKSEYVEQLQTVFEQICSKITISN